MVTHCDVDFRAGQSTATRGKAGRAAVDLLFVTRMLFEAAIAECEGSSFLFFLDFRGEDMILHQTAVNTDALNCRWKNQSQYDEYLGSRWTEKIGH